MTARALLALATLGACATTPMPASQIHDPITLPGQTVRVDAVVRYDGVIAEYSDGVADRALSARAALPSYGITDRLELAGPSLRFAALHGDSGACPGPLQLAVQAGFLSIGTDGARFAAQPLLATHLRKRFARLRLDAQAIGAIPVGASRTALAGTTGAAMLQLFPGIAGEARISGELTRERLPGPYRDPMAPRPERTIGRMTASAAILWRMERAYDIALGTALMVESTDVDDPPVRDPGDPAPPIFEGRVWAPRLFARFSAYW